MTKKAEFKKPFEIFSSWLERAKNEKSVVDHTAMCLATVDENSSPSARMVLLKHFDERGFCFYTNLTSRKGKELAHNQNVALCFYWDKLGLQIRIEGAIEKVTLKEADDYFASRRRESQLGAWASKQSCEMENQEEFAQRLKKITEDFKGQDVPRPPFWSGFRVVPKRIEFWQEGDFRLHTREVYQISSDKNSWDFSRIYP